MSENPAPETIDYDPRILDLLDPELGDYDREVSRRDEMLAFFRDTLEQGLYRGLSLYFSSGARLWSHFASLLASRPGGIAGLGRVLDFASGYGRLTRHLVGELGPERVQAAEIQEEALDFLRERLGVRGWRTSYDPDDFRCDERFDAILVSSLFTHLPRESFEGWLRRLLGLLTPEGWLLFSVHGPEILGPDRELPESGFLFEPLSESDSLAPSEYGTSWVNRGFVERLLERLAPERRLLLLSRGLLSFQDLWVVVPEGHALPAAPPDALEFHLDLCRPEQGAERLRMQGWLVDRRGGETPREFRLELGGRNMPLQLDVVPRPEVERLFPSEALRPIGFDISAGLAEESGLGDHLGLRVRDAQGVEHPLFDAPLYRALDRSTRLEAFALLEEETARIGAKLAAEASQREGWSAYEIELLEGRLQAMEASRFWKARNLWFKLKQTLFGAE